MTRAMLLVNTVLAAEGGPKYRCYVPTEYQSALTLYCLAATIAETAVK